MQTSGDASPLRRLGSMCPKVDCASHSPWPFFLCRAGEDGRAMLSSVPDRSPAWTAITVIPCVHRAEGGPFTSSPKMGERVSA